MTYEEAEQVASLIAGWGADGSAITLTCAEDVFGEIQEVDGLASAAEVIKIPHYQPGQWKLTRHDQCQVTGGETIDAALIISHKDCTVIGRNDG